MNIVFQDFPEIEPIVFGVWCGFGKPIDVNEYLMPFVQEMNAVAKNGVMINGYRLDVNIRALICDSPARSFLKGLDFSILLV